MKMKLAENIRAFRKERKLTQERLSEILGVTVAAVSKWESAQTTPDLGLLVEMAKLFETSVDVLVGYTWEKSGLERTLDELSHFILKEDFEAGFAAAEKALLKYPNHFQVVYQCARLYHAALTPKAALRSLELFQRACGLIDQNTDESIGIVSIQNRMAELYLLVLNQPEKGLELLKKNNFGGLNNGMIGYTLSLDEKKAEEALPYLSDALFDCELELYRTCIGYANAYSQKGMEREAVDILLWLIGNHKGLKKPGLPSYMDKEDVVVYIACATIAARKGWMEEASEYVKKALELARWFDAAPSLKMDTLRFYHGASDRSFVDNYGQTAVESAENMLKMDKDGAALLPLWEEMLNEK